MAHTFNRDELIPRILQKHRVIGEGQSATDGQRAIVAGTIDSGIEELRSRQVVNLNANGDMPIKYKEFLADYLSFFSAADFSMPADIGAKTYAETQLRFIEALPTTRQPVPVDSLHAPSYGSGFPGYGYGSRGYR